MFRDSVRTDAGRRREGRSSDHVLIPGAGGRAARCAAAGKDLDNNHAAAAARAWRATETPDELVGAERHCAVPHLPVAAVILLHVLPKGFHRIRHYGRLASAGCKANIARAKELMGAPIPEVEPPAAHDATAADATTDPLLLRAHGLEQFPTTLNSNSPCHCERSEAIPGGQLLVRPEIASSRDALLAMTSFCYSN
jgi:hypothetical protein